MVRKLTLPLAVAAIACFAPTAAPAQVYGSMPMIDYGGGYPDDGNYGGYYEDDPRAQAAARQWWERERWEEQRRWAEARERQWQRERMPRNDDWGGDEDGY